VLGATDDILGGEQSPEEQVAQQGDDVTEREQPAVMEKATEENKKLSTDLHCLKYEAKKLKTK
jgi:hypothetical protein